MEEYVLNNMNQSVGVMIKLTLIHVTPREMASHLGLTVSVQDKKLYQLNIYTFLLFN
jgi:hypothetical protein